MKLLAIALLVVAKTFVIEQEPNNRLNDAQFVGHLFKENNNIRLQGLIRHPKDIDCYVYRVSEKTDLRLTVITGGLSVPVFPGFTITGGMTFAPWLRVYDGEGHLLIEKEGYSGNILIPNLHIERPMILFVQISSLGLATYPLPGPDIYYLKISDSLQP